jgi:hypothetical protein
MKRILSYALFLLLLLLIPVALADVVMPGQNSFVTGRRAYQTDDFTGAAQAFRESAMETPAAGTFQNLGNAEWQRGRVGPAILAWEKALWLLPADTNALNNLQFARSAAQIEAPELTWYEVVSTWMPSGWWAMLTAFSLWLVAGLLVLPGLFRSRRTGWQQALAAIGLTLLLLTLPAHAGWHTRSKIGFVLEQNTPLRLTPTESAEEITRVGAGEPGRCERTFGNYYFIRFRNGAGWLTRDEFGLVAGK